MAATSWIPERIYMYYHHHDSGGWWVSATRDEWLSAILTGDSRPKPPEWWLAQQAAEGRTRQQASIIWGRHYKPERKHAIWSMASDEDFVKEHYR